MRRKAMMKMRLFVICFGLTLTILFCAMFPVATMAAEKPIKWRMVSLYPRGVAFGKCFPPFVERVKAMSNGRLEIEMVYEGEGVDATQMFNSMKSGMVEMGRPYMALHAGECPSGVVELGLPGGPGNYAELLALAIEGGWADVLKKSYAKHGLVYLGEIYQPGPYLLTKKPISNLNELKELKIRAPGAYGKFIRKLGGTPVVITFGELYTSLVTGVIDGVTGPNLVDYADTKIFEAAKYLYPLQVASAQLGPVLVNMGAWNKLPNDLKAILETASLSLGVDKLVKSVVWEKESLQKMIARGLKMSPEPSAEDKAKWRKAGMDIWPEYAGEDEFSKELIRVQTQFLKRLGY